LLRRLLALADVTAAGLGALSISVPFGGRVDQTVWALALLPIWIVLSKLHGLYDRDQRTLRHLTVDELPPLLVWASTGTALLALFLIASPAGGLSGGTAIRAWLVTWTAAFVLRATVRAAWRRLIPAERTLVVGRGALAD